MTSAIFTHALWDYLRPRKVLVWILLGLFCLGLAAVWNRLDQAAKPVDQYTSVTSILVFRLLALASAIYTTAIVTQEVDGKTIAYLLTRPVPRWKLLFARYVASILVVALLSIITVVLTSMGAYKGAFLSNPLLARDILSILCGAAAYGALFLLVSLLFNRALIICALFAFGWEASVPSLPGDLYHLSIFSYLQAVADHPESGSKVLAIFQGSDKIQSIPAGQAFMVLAAIVVGSLALSAFVFTHFEFVPREDAE